MTDLTSSNGFYVAIVDQSQPCNAVVVMGPITDNTGKVINEIFLGAFDNENNEFIDENGFIVIEEGYEWIDGPFQSITFSSKLDYDWGI